MAQHSRCPSLWKDIDKKDRDLRSQRWLQVEWVTTILPCLQTIKKSNEACPAGTGIFPFDLASVQDAAGCATHTNLFAHQWFTEPWLSRRIRNKLQGAELLQCQDASQIGSSPGFFPGLNTCSSLSQKLSVFLVSSAFFFSFFFFSKWKYTPFKQ